MPWLLNEDEALKKKLTGLTISSVNDANKSVPVRFRFPETELAKVTFPMIVIEHNGLTRAEDREHHGSQIFLPYAPEGYDLWSDPTDPTKSPYRSEWPIPYDIDYVVTLYSRHAMHDRLLTSRLMQDDMFHRFGFLEIPQDGTVRRLDTIGGPFPADIIDDEGKRLFRKAWTVRVSSELLPSQITVFTNIVNKVTFDLNYYADAYDIQNATPDGTISVT